MFTGLVEGIGTLIRLEPRGEDLHLTIQASFDLTDLEIGESIMVDGACLTVVSREGNSFTVDASRETLSRTTLGQRRQGHRVHLERALRLGDRVGGHLVNGHVDDRARVSARRKMGESLILEFEVPAELGRYLIEKGSVSVNGVSLTVNHCDESRFDVNIVPHTARVTNLPSLRVGDEVNIEVDSIGKYVEKFVRSLRKNQSPTTKNLDRNFLDKHGFL